MKSSGKLNKSKSDGVIFISYSRSDGREIAAGLRKKLSALGFDLWQDVISLAGGEDWWQQIVQAIDGARTMVMILTEAALKSEVVRREWAHARHVGTHIMPVAIDSSIFERSPGWIKKIDVFILNENDPDYKLNNERFLKQIKDPPVRKPVPNMTKTRRVPEYFAERRILQSKLFNLLLNENRTSVYQGKVAVLGAAGFGKTRLVERVCEDPYLVELFSDGILWATIGEGRVDIKDKFNSMITALTGIKTTFNNEDDAGRRFRELIQDRNCLVVLDDVWNVTDIDHFTACKGCALLITTREPEVAATADRKPLFVEEMEPDEAVNLLVNLLPESTKPDSNSLKQMYELSAMLGEWPLLLELFGGSIRRQLLIEGKSLQQALNWEKRGIEKRGILLGDARHPRSRNRALAKSIGLSLELYTIDERARLYELSIFREDIEIPDFVIMKLWQESAGFDEFDSSRLLQQFNGHFFRMSAKQPGGPLFIRFHDVLRTYFASQIDDTTKHKTHSQLLSAYNPDRKNWWEIDHDGYIYHELVYHLAAAGRSSEVHTLLTGSPKWMRVSSEKTGSHAAYISDLKRTIKGYESNNSINALISLLDLHSALQVAYASTDFYTDSDLEILVWLGDIDIALNYAVARSGPVKKNQGMLSIYKTLLKTDSEQKTKKFIYIENELLKEAQANRLNNELLHDLSLALTKSGKIEIAETITKKIKSPELSASALMELGLAFANAGDSRSKGIFDLCMKNVNSIESEDYDWRVDNTKWKRYTRELVYALCEAKDIGKAREVLSYANIYLGDHDADRLKRLLEDHELISKKHSLKAINPRFIKSSLEEKAHLVDTLVDMGHLEISYEVLTCYLWLFYEGQIKAKSLIKIATAYIPRNKKRAREIFDEAYKVLCEIPKGRREVPQLLLTLGHAQKSVNKNYTKYFSEALKEYEFISKIDPRVRYPSRRYEAEFLIAYCSALASCNDSRTEKYIKQTIKYIEGLGQGIAKYKGILSRKLVISLAEVGYNKTSVIFSKVFKKFPLYNSGLVFSKAAALCTLAISLAKNGNVHNYEVLNFLLNYCSMTLDRDDAYESHELKQAMELIITSLVTANQTTLARSILEKFKDGGYLWKQFNTALADKNNADNAIALADRMKFNEARKVLADIESKYHRIKVLIYIAEAMIRAKQEGTQKIFSEAERIARLIGNATFADSELQCIALRELSLALARTGDISNANRIAHLLSSEYNRTKLLDDLAGMYRKKWNHPLKLFLMNQKQKSKQLALIRKSNLMKEMDGRISVAEIEYRQDLSRALISIKQLALAEKVIDSVGSHSENKHLTVQYFMSEYFKVRTPFLVHEYALEFDHLELSSQKLARECALELSSSGQFEQGLSILRKQTVDDFISFVGSLLEVLEAKFGIEGRKLHMKLMIQVIGKVAWIRKDWQEIYNLICPY